MNFEDMEGTSPVSLSQENVAISLKQGTPSDDELEDLGEQIAEKWMKLGRRLNIGDAKLQEIHQTHDQISEKGYHMLKHWKQENGSDATYQALSDALRHKLVQRQDLAEQFCFINIGTSAIQLPAGAVCNFASASTCDSEASSKDQQYLSTVRSGLKRKILEPNHDRGKLPCRIFCASATSRNSKEQDSQEARAKVEMFMLSKIDKGRKLFDICKLDGIDDFCAYLKGHLINVDRIEASSIKITVICRTLKILEWLWNDYRSGHLNKVAENCLITEKVKDDLDMETITLTTTILEEDYLACKLSLVEILENRDLTIRGREAQHGNSSERSDLVHRSDGRRLPSEQANKDDDSFDLIQPSLIQQLRSILDQVPDDSQVLKELIQNAEDANASHVKFLHDKHNYGTARLFDEDLALFQGPALYSYNNALFTKEDWRGIRLVCDSNKVDDPMKVGRFGLGFKSVFHMTDLPSLLSGSKIGFIDPHGIHFSDKYHRRTGKHWRLNEDCVEMDEIPDQFTPYRGIFDCTEEVFSQGFYNGTLFRFPFRAKPSELSETLYTAEKMDTLFASFETDAHLVLLFLRHLESIELYVREESQTDPEIVFQVKIADKSLQTVRAKRKEFLSKITPGRLMKEPITVTYPITIETIKFDSHFGKVVEQHSFLVTNYFCGGEVSSRFKKLMTDKALNYLPTVGVAMALPTGPKLQTPDIKGHVFCFLPLPVHKTSFTGLPVHVNGFFALSQNRRYIKSPNAKSLLWNRCLLEEAIPRAYARMILEAINEKCFIIPRTSIYKAWPNVRCNDQKWEKIKEPLLQFLLREKVVYTEVDGGHWLTVEQAVFDLLPENEPKELLQRVLVAAYVPVVSVPSHVMEAIACYFTIKYITPSLIRATLKRFPSSYKNLSRPEKLLLLQFCLQDQKCDKLCDLMLLPLSNGAFETFSNQGKRIYISSPQHPQELFPSLEHRFVDNAVGVGIIEQLKEVAKKGVTQLRLLCEHDVPTLLQQALPSEWNNGNTVSWYPDDCNHNHPPKDWIKVVWRYLQEYFTTAKEIRTLGKLPLIPLNMAQTPVLLTRLCHSSRVVVKRLNDDYLENTLSNVLTKLGLIVLEDYPTFISHHPAVLGTFVKPPSAQGVLKAMVVSSHLMGAGQFSETVHKVLSNDEKRLLRSFLANVRPFYMGPAEYTILSSLSVFETLSKKFVSKEEGLCAAPDEILPVFPRQELIDITEQDSKTLALLLDVKILKPTELLCQIVFPDIQRGRYSAEQIDKLMTYVLDRHASDIRRNATFRRHLESLLFVSKNNGRARASDLFDPRDEFLKKIFANENVFPAAVYVKSSVLVMLEELGMKSQRNITCHDLYQSASLVSRLSHLPTAEQKSKTILQFLSDNPQKLRKPVNGKALGLLLENIPWVVRLQERPPNYPPGLPWWGTNEEGKRFFKPTEVKSHHFANLIGTVMPVVEVETSNQISQFFGWQNQPDVLEVVQHLQTVIQSYSKEEKPFYMVVVNEIYLFLSGAKHADLNPLFDWFKECDWVWNGDGFSLPNHLLSRKPHIDLTPYIRSLPSDMMKYSDLFYRFGMRESSEAAVLVQVLTLMKEKYGNESTSFSALEVKHDLHLSVNILNELASDQLPEELQAQIVFPTHVEDDSYVRLEPVEHCMYCEQEWLKREGDDEDTGYFCLHPNVPISTAERLGVPPLTNRMLDPDELFIGEEFGQEERLTTRLNQLLEEYTDGFSVLKELVQNADDAGATEVRFLYDERTNEDAMTCLFDEGMKGCQGPALWVYNDAEFKDEDFGNITKLNEATKVYDTEKIGRFGLGFNAVYNLTDVPMFLSRNYFVIFDPHTSYLGKAIKNKRKPGMKIDLNKEVKRLRKFTNQFKPFNGIFGCDLHLDKENNSFDGTLFRFPLRTSEQALRSEIKNLAYNDQQMRELLLMLVNGAKTLLLFTQNVLRVSIFSLKPSANENQKTTLAFQVSKSLSQAGIIRPLSVPVTLPATAKKLTTDDQDFLKQCNFLQASSQLTRAFRKGASPKVIKSSMKVDVKCSFTEYGRKFFASDLPSHQECSTWLVVSSMGNGPALRFAKNDLSLLSSAGVAVELGQNGSDNCLPLPIEKKVDGYFVNGILFCYLPLPIHSGLPVHLNGAFALTANRRHLQEKVEGDKKCYGVDWNNVLMQDSISSAYLCLLDDLKSIAASDGSYKFHSLWPKVSVVHRNCLPLIKSFYVQIARGSNSLFSDGRKWLDISQVVFLDPDFRNEPVVGDISLQVFQMLMKGSSVAVDVPVDVLRSFKLCGLSEVLKPKIYNKDRFFHEVFFPNLPSVPPESRNALVLHALDTNCDFLLTTHACIPASPCGMTLRCPCQLIHPHKEAAQLFLPEDERFPCGTKESFLHPQRLAKLETLGMASNYLPWQEIAERAESIQKLNVVNSDAACERMRSLLQFMEKKKNYEYEDPINDTIQRRILDAKFLPVLKKANDFSLPWKGDEFGSKELLAPKDLFLEKEKYLLCCTEPLVGVPIPQEVKSLLKLDKKHATLLHVIAQLDEAISIEGELLEGTVYNEISSLCNAAYSFLQKALKSNAEAVKRLLNGKQFIFVAKTFLCARQVAFSLKTDCPPYLYQLPELLAVTFPKLMVAAGVRKQFEEKDYISSLHQMKRSFSDNELDEQSLQVAVHLADQLGETLKASGVDPSKVQEKFGTVFLPDSRGVMRPVSELCIKDCPWMLDEPEVHFVTDRIPWPTCDQVGVKTRREEALRQHVVRIPFGQREKLTNRLKRILTSYPCEKEILKELLQNADDAQATEICFIKDPRYHPNKRVFEDRWQPLQGPALCVYNNKPFTHADIEGIQKLGEGSKAHDPNKTGQYGVGFNAVYHLTDVPSFISKGEEIGDVLCVFDPHCTFVPGASAQEPGRMFKVDTTLQRCFPDVFPCYLGNLFPRDDAIMFRFPLRTDLMARESKISSITVSLQTLDTMMNQLKEELFEVLLFVNNVKKITLCEVNETNGNLANAYTVEADMSKEDEVKRQKFADYIKQVGKLVKEGREILPNNIPVEKVSYVLNITDTLGNKEKWLIVQQIGFEKSVKPGIINAYREHQLGMLPRGGVACLLEKRSPRYPDQRPKKAYCFLPLPLETNLPVHINGHFALNHEARRNLWRDEVGGYLSDWNNALLEDLVVSCYVTLLVEVRNFLKLPIDQDASPGTEVEILQKIEVFETVFPREPPTDSYWQTLVNSLYQEIDKKELKVLPVVRSRSLDAQKSSNVVKVMWLPPTGSGKDQAYFNDLAVTGPFAMSPKKETDENHAKLRHTFESMLLESGFNLVAFSLALHKSFQQAGVTTSSISPNSVIDFYGTFSSVHSLCTIGPVPCAVNETSLKDVLGVIILLLYCRGDAGFLDKLPGLPFLLTQDSRLQLFSIREPKFLSRFQDLLPGSPEVFLHEQVYESIFRDSAFNSLVLKPLDAKAFAVNLPRTLPWERYGNAEFVQWSPNNKAPPNQRWIFRVWVFLHELVQPVLDDVKMDEQAKNLQIKKAFEILSNWSIIPATETKSTEKKASMHSFSPLNTAPPVEHFLVPLGQASSVVDFKNADSSSQKLVEALRKLGLPELNTAALSTMISGTSVYSSPNSVALARMIVSSLKSPTSVLTALHQKMELDAQSLRARLEPQDCRTVLEYFSKSVSCLQNADRTTLRRLPFYQARHGGMIRLDERKVCVLPIGIPRKEIDVLERALSVVFVEFWSSISELFKFLELECVSDVDVYCTFILTNVSILSTDAIQVHLEYIRKSILENPFRELEDGDKQKLLQCLTDTPLVPSVDGTLKTASCFYDPQIGIFRTMLPESMFPSAPFNSSEWLMFLRNIGLVHKVTKDQFKRFSLLDSTGVRQDDSYSLAEDEIYPEPGSFIPLEDHHRLNDAFEEFDPGDYVGYELEDPSLHRKEGNATYIYAVIIEKVTNEGDSPLAKRYRIDIGDGQEVVVDAVDLYKFHCLNVSASSSAIVVSDQPGELPRNRSRQEVFDEISDMLEEAWKLTEEKRRKIIKRLYLRWHPDKNLGNEEFCSEVCKHIQGETSRLERGEPRGSQSSNKESRTQGGTYDDFFTFWGARARQHHSERQGCSARQHSSRNSYRRNPQPGEARRWFKQAEADVAAVESDIVYSKLSYEWACFKCHQAAEKALKAVQYTIDADKRSVHNLVENCCGLGDPQLTELARQLENLVGDSTRMRYPDRMRFPQIPNEVYSSQMAQQALQLAKKIVERVKDRII